MFLKKLLLFVGLVSNLYSAPQNSEDITFKIQERVGNSYILFDSTVKAKTWIGIYRKDKSNEWENVKKWEWVRKPITKIDILFLETGDYEARLFFNNSFISEKAIEFHMEAGPAQNCNHIKDTTIYISHSDNFNIESQHHESELDWVGIFNIGTKHTKENLLAWGYVNNNIKTINGKKLRIGNYDMVYFLNDSYHQLGDIVNLKIDFNAKFTQRISGTSNHILDSYEYIKYVKQENDWIAIFKKDAEPIKKNIIAWSYIDDGVPAKGREEVDYLLEFPSITHIYPYTESEKYKVIIFEKDSYKIIKTIVNPY